MCKCGWNYLQRQNRISKFIGGCFMGIIIDIVIVAVIGLSIFMGYKKGLIGVAFKILSFLIAIVLAFILSKPVSNYIIENTEFDDNIRTTIQETLESKNFENTNQTEENNMPAIITEYVVEQIQNVTAEAQNEVASIVAINLTQTVINGIAFIGIFIVAKIALLFLKFLAEAIAEIPLIKQFNELGGVIYGVLKGFFIVYLFFAIVSLLAPVINMAGFLDIINASYLGNMLYDNNLLLRLLF